MPINNEYKRYFIILQEDGKNYGIASGKAPTGYVKIEVKSGSGRINIFIQNLRNDRNADYRVLIVAPEKNIGVYLGRVLIDDAGRGELNVEVNSSNVMNSNCDISQFSVAAICDGGNFPLSGYIGRDKTSWKGKYIVVNEKDKKTENISREAEKVEKAEMIEKVEEKSNFEAAAEEYCEEENIEELEKVSEEKEIEYQEESEDKILQEDNKKTEEMLKENICEDSMEGQLCEEECKECEIPQEIPVREEICEDNKAEEFREEDLCEELSFEECEIPEMEIPVPQEIEYDKCECETENENEKPECVEYKCYKADYENDVPYYDTNMYFSLKKTMRKMARCEVSDDEYEWFTVGDRVKYLNSVMVKVNGNYMLLSYPFMVNVIASKSMEDCMIGLKYDDKGEYVRFIVYAVPGERNVMYRRYFRRLGYNEYKNGYYLLYLDISK